MTGVWQEACVLSGPSSVSPTSTLHTLHDPKGSRFGASHRVGMASLDLFLLMKEMMV